MGQHPKGDFDLSRAVWQRAEGDTSDSAVEVAFVDDLIGMRNSAEPDGPVPGLHPGRVGRVRRRRPGRRVRPGLRSG